MTYPIPQIVLQSIPSLIQELTSVIPVTEIGRFATITGLLGNIETCRSAGREITSKCNRYLDEVIQLGILAPSIKEVIDKISDFLVQLLQPLERNRMQLRINTNEIQTIINIIKAKPNPVSCVNIESFLREVNAYYINGVQTADHADFMHHFSFYLNSKAVEEDYSLNISDKKSFEKAIDSTLVTLAAIGLPTDFTTSPMSATLTAMALPLSLLQTTQKDIIQKRRANDDRIFLNFTQPIIASVSRFGIAMQTTGITNSISGSLIKSSCLESTGMLLWSPFVFGLASDSTLLASNVQTAEGIVSQSKRSMPARIWSWIWSIVCDVSYTIAHPLQTERRLSGILTDVGGIGIAVEFVCKLSIKSMNPYIAVPAAIGLGIISLIGVGLGISQANTRINQQEIKDLEAAIKVLLMNSTTTTLITTYRDILTQCESLKDNATSPDAKAVCRILCALGRLHTGDPMKAVQLLKEAYDVVGTTEEIKFGCLLNRAIIANNARLSDVPQVIRDASIIELFSAPYDTICIQTFRNFFDTIHNDWFANLSDAEKYKDKVLENNGYLNTVLTVPHEIFSKKTPRFSIDLLLMQVLLLVHAQETRQYNKIYKSVREMLFNKYYDRNMGNTFHLTASLMILTFPMLNKVLDMIIYEKTHSITTVASSTTSYKYASEMNWIGRFWNIYGKQTVPAIAGQARNYDEQQFVDMEAKLPIASR